MTRAMLGIGGGDMARACILPLGSVYTDDRTTYQLEVGAFELTLALFRAYK